MKAPTIIANANEKKLPTKAINVPLRAPSESRCLCSRRLGHGSPVITMAVYAHLFDCSDETAAKAIDSVLKANQ
jgi:hypothetical protein